MAKASKPRNREEPPDLEDREAFEKWLNRQPREWSVILAARAALRVLPLVGAEVRGREKLPAAVLTMFRATAIARYPNRAIDISIAARAAADAAHDAAVAHAVAYAYAYAAYAAAAADVAAAAHAAAYAYAYADADAAARAAAYAAVAHDARRLHDRSITAEQLASEQLWPDLPPKRIGRAWQVLARELRYYGGHWSVWIDWYDDILGGTPTSEAEDAAFTDIPGELPWDHGAAAVNGEIAGRLKELQAIQSALVRPKPNLEEPKTRILARLAEVASPQPSITDKKQLDAGPNQPFDLPKAHNDLSTLPLRQRNLIKVILRDLPANAPNHLKDFLRSYDDELKSRGAQPILGLLQDDADIVAAAVAAPRAEDEWLESGMRKAFDRFTENHQQFVTHFPLDAEREKLYADTPVNEAEATGIKFVEPFEKVAEAARAAHQAGTTTDDFLMVIDKMTEFARVVSTQPPASSSNQQGYARPEDRTKAVTTKKRVILGSLGFFTGTLGLTSFGRYLGDGAIRQPARGLEVGNRNAVPASPLTKRFRTEARLHDSELPGW